MHSRIEEHDALLQIVNKRELQSGSLETRGEGMTLQDKVDGNRHYERQQDSVWSMKGGGHGSLRMRSE